MRDRIAAETEEERDIRLQHIRTTQIERLAAETAEQRDARMQCDRERHRDYQVVHPQLLLVRQRAIKAKMLKFHEHIQ